METNDYTIKERFDYLEAYIKLIMTQEMNSLIINGTSGIGKSHTVIKHLSDGDKKYIFVKGFSTARALYDTLYQNRQSIVVFDDCDNILQDKVAVNILKGALDSYDERVISWLAKSTDKSIPLQFNFQGQIIFISNLKTSVFDDAMKSRALTIDLTMTYEEKISRMMDILIDIKPTVDYAEKYKVLVMLMNNVVNEDDINLRTLEKAIVLNEHNPEGIEKQIKFMLMG